jgi:hypothetical protein
MSFQLSNANRETEVGYTDWVAVLRMAGGLGWQPAGTVANEEDPDLGHAPALCNGPYASNDGLCVSGEDARALAAALRRACSRWQADGAGNGRTEATFLPEPHPCRGVLQDRARKVQVGLSHCRRVHGWNRRRGTDKHR